MELKPDKLGSGYATNASLCDGKTWTTEKNLHSELVRSLYDTEFNKPKPFHKVTLKSNDGRLKK